MLSAFIFAVVIVQVSGL